MRSACTYAWILAAAVLFTSIGACSDSPTEVDSTEPAPNLVITPPGPNAWDCIDPEDPHCLPGPGGDPYPDSAGVWLGTVAGGQQVSFLWCTNFGSDTDADGVAEYCEDKLAETFRPLMISWELDDVDGEPYYAVKEAPGNKIQIMYMLAYYWDWGDCNAAGFCSGGHAGDSEFVVVEVRYNAATKHWVFVRMALSQHGGFEWIPSPLKPVVEFPVKDGWYPNVYVADGKHANYSTRDICEESAFFGAESCSYPSIQWRPEVDPQYNVGSRVAPQPDVPFNEHGNQYTCVEARDYTHRVLFNYDGFECFWGLSANFAGWQGGNLEIAPYNDYLTQFGF